MKIAIATRALLCTSLFFSLTLTGCFAKLQPLPAHTQQSRLVFASLPDKPVLVRLAISGGGSQAGQQVVNQQREPLDLFFYRTIPSRETTS